MKQDESSKLLKAPIAIGRLRRALGANNPAFLQADLVESEAEAFCMKVRKDLRERRKALRIDQANMASRMNLSQSAISKIENGRGDFGIKTLHRYCNALGMRPVVVFVASPYSVVEDDAKLNTREAVEEANAITSAQDMFLRKMSEMVPSLTAGKVKQA